MSNQLKFDYGSSLPFTSEIVNCTLSPWSDWSYCSETCRFEDKTSTRQIEQEAAYGGYDCTGDLTKNKSCDKDDLCQGNNPITLFSKLRIMDMNGQLKLISCFYLYADDFVIVDSKHCRKSKYGSYSNLLTAKVSCFEDSQCLGVYDYDCDGKDNYGLCPISNVTEYSEKSCVYKKKQYSGV